LTIRKHVRSRGRGSRVSITSLRTHTLVFKDTKALMRTLRREFFRDDSRLTCAPQPPVRFLQSSGPAVGVCSCSLCIEPGALYDVSGIS
jgi:hypothetical protein